MRFRRPDVQAEWLKALSDRFLTDEEKAQIEAMGGFDKFMRSEERRVGKEC